MDGNNMNDYNGMNNQNNGFNNIPNEPVNLGNGMPNQNDTMNSGVSGGINSVNNGFNNTNVTPNMNYGSMNNNISNPTVGNFNGNMMGSSSNSYNSGRNDDFMFKKEKKIWPIVLIVVVLLVAGLLCGYYFVVMSPKNIMTKTIDSMYTKVDEAYKSIKDNQNSSNSKGVVDGNITFTSKEFNANFSADYYMGYDISNEEKPIAYFEINAKYNDKGPVNAAFYVEDNIVYLLVKDIYSKAIGFDLKTLGNITGGNTDSNCIGSDGTNCASDSLIGPSGPSISLNDVDFNVDDIKYLTDLVKDSLKNSINYDKVSKTIKTDSGLYFETVYNFDSEEQDNISKGIKDTIKNDDKALEILAKIYGTTKDEVKNSLNDTDESLSSIKNNSTTSTDTDLKIILHTGIIDNKLTYFEMGNDNATLTAVVNDKETTVELKENKDSKPVMSIKFDDNSLSGEFNSDDGEYNKVTFSLKTTKKDKNSEVTSSFVIYSSKDSSNPAFNITISATEKPGEQMKSFDKSNVVMYDKLTENDMNTMAYNLINLLDKLGIELPTTDDSGTM